MIRLLTFSTLYPNACQPAHGIFVENRLRTLLSSGRVTSRVVAPVGFFPFRHKVFGRYGKLAQISLNEWRFDIQVDHPRYLVIPKFGMNWAPRLLYQGARRHLKRLFDAGHRFDLIDAHYFYPDGVAAAYLAREFGLPFVVTGRGSDITLLPYSHGPRHEILKTAKKADGIITVSNALKQDLIALGVSSARISVFRNGVDLELFHPQTREQARAAFRFNRRVIASVGHLIPRKGHDLVIRVLTELPADVALVIVGEGPEHGRLVAITEEVGVSDRVTFLGPMSQEDLARLYNGVELTVLASSREGMANVLLESLACGTPVVATNVGGSAEVVSDPAAGILVKERSVAAIAGATACVLENPPSREATRAHAERFSWDATTRGQLELFQSILERSEGTD